MGEVNQPLLVPHPIESASGSFSHTRGEIRSTEGTESILRPRPDVRIPGVYGHSQAGHHQEGDEVTLVQHVRVRPSRQTTPVMQVTTNRISLIAESGGNAVLNHLEGRSVGHVVDARQVRVHQLVDRLLAKMRGCHHQLRYVGAHRFPREGAAEQQIRSYVSVAVSRTAVA